MRRSKLNDLIFRFLKRVGIETSYSQRLEIEKKLHSIFFNASGINRHLRNKVNRHIQVMQIRDAADVYNLFMTLCRGSTIICSYLKDGKAEYISAGMILKYSYTSNKNGYIARLIFPSDYQLNGIKEIRFKKTKRSLTY